MSSFSLDMLTALDTRIKAMNQTTKDSIKPINEFAQLYEISLNKHCFLFLGLLLNMVLK